jgi:hypothetical protein
MKKRRGRAWKKFIKPIFAWFVLIVFINIFPPENILHFMVFYLIFFLSIFTTLKLIFATFRSLSWTTIIITFLILKQAKIENIINTILLLGILLTIEIYFRKV